MCRLFGFRSVINSQVHSSLVQAENALMTQSSRHPDGWGVAYYVENIPHIIKSQNSALDDHLFRKVSGIVSSQTVLAHIRKATHGDLNPLNAHPFQYGPWVFAHNGNIKDFQIHRERILKLIDPGLKRFILGETDSEVVFYYLLTKIKKHFNLSATILPVNELVDILEEALLELISIIGELSQSRLKAPPSENFLTFIISCGPILVGFEGGQPLHRCTYKQKCPERLTCASFNESCEKKSQNKDQVNHLILTSEPILGINIWEEVPQGSFIGIGGDMRLIEKASRIPFKS